MADFSFKTEDLYSKVNKFYKILGLVLIVIGIAGITYPFWGGIFYRNTGPLEELGRLELQAQEINQNLLPVESNPISTPDSATVAPINRLILDSAGVNMPLFVSGNEKVLLKGGWMYSGNSRPDQGGNTVIFGHRWLYKPPVKNTFYNLDEVKLGDKFTITWNGRTYTYETSDIKVVNPEDVWVMTPTDTPQVTLITCTPLFSTAQRLVVIGKLI